MSVAYLKAMAGAALLLACAGVQAADLSVRVDAREIARRHVHTELTLAVTGGPLTLVFPQWIPGEHGPTGPLDTLVGLQIRANGALLTWQRDPRDMFAINLKVPAGVTRLEIGLDTGLPTEGGEFTAGPSSSAQLAVIAWNQFVLLPKGRDAANDQYRGLAARAARVAAELRARAARAGRRQRAPGGRLARASHRLPAADGTLRPAHRSGRVRALAAAETHDCPGGGQRGGACRAG